jgi:hypothetical protein
MIQRVRAKVKRERGDNGLRVDDDVPTPPGRTCDRAFDPNMVVETRGDLLLREQGIEDIFNRVASKSKDVNTWETRQAQ